MPVERLVDEVWGNDPPPSAAHTLESYISRLRQLFNGHGPALVRRGAGYAIELGEDASLDALGFLDLQERASLSAATDDHAAPPTTARFIEGTFSPSPRRTGGGS